MHTTVMRFEILILRYLARRGWENTARAEESFGGRYIGESLRVLPETRDTSFRVCVRDPRVRGPRCRRLYAQRR